MKVLNLLKKNKLIVFVILAYAIVFIISPEKGILSLKNSGYYLIEMLQVLPTIFLLTVVIEAWIPKELIMRGFGEKSGIRGNLLSLLLGSISAGPIYAAFPIGKSLLSKGASITNIVIILSSWAVIKIPMLANEAKFLGLNFMAVRWVLTVIAILIMGYLTAVFVKKEDLPEDEFENEGDILVVNEEYCIGCGICNEISPQFYEMVEKKAVIKALPENEEEIKAVIITVGKCPTGAIVFNSEMEQV